ncbi:putative ATP-dependent RNA helicase ddx56 [Blomia tropicalis]|nr:putative ATP-dependent RNA helicase ddx56 [Blomia tropicalis]
MDNSAQKSVNFEVNEPHFVENDSEIDEEDGDEEIVSFDEMGLDNKILHAIASLGWSYPTLIQEKTIRLALDGHDILARARTGTGKTGAFSIPIIHRILEIKKHDSTNKFRALILAPSRELSAQLFTHFRSLTSHCLRQISIIDLSSGTFDDRKGILVAEKPDILIATPKKIIEYFTAKLLNSMKTEIKFLVIDESDLMFSFGYEQDLNQVLNLLPKSGVQSFLMSATLNTDVKELKKLVLHKPVILKLEEPDLPESSKLLQYHVEVFDDEEKFVLVNALFKLGLIMGKTIIFVNSVDRCYQLKLFLEQFAIRTCVLNSELPVASRSFVVEQFNSNVYDIIIASDEKCVIDPGTRDKKRRFRLTPKSNVQYGVARGIDFKFVSNIINFDFATTVDSYIHRVGRTARGNEEAEGTVLSFVSPKETKYFQKVAKKFADKGNFKPYQFKMDELEAFKYRARDALRAVTSIAIKEARLKEIKREMLASQALKSFFKEHPKDYKILKFDRPLCTVKSKVQLSNVPEYIVPQTLQTAVRSKRENKRIEEIASMSYEPSRKKRKPKISKKPKDSDPLQTFRLNAIKRYKDKKRTKRRPK